jgi:Ras-related protein Rab-7A
MSNNRKRHINKVIVLGDSGVGKTSLLKQYVNKQFTHSHKPTIGADFLLKELIIESQVVQLQLWDTAGQEKFHSLGAAFYRNSECCILVYDMTEPKTFDTIDTWRSEFLTQLNPKDPDNFPFVVLGNKCDKESDLKVDLQKVKAYCSQKNMQHFEVSAKDNINIDTAFEEVAKLAFKRDQEDEV